MRLLMTGLMLIPAMLFSTLVIQTPAAAVDVLEPVCSTNSAPGVCDRDTGQTESNNVLVGPNGMITRVAEVLVWISGILAVILIIIAGFMYMFSNGNPEKTGRARSTIIYAVVGLIIAVVGQLIVSFVLEKL